MRLFKKSSLVLVFILIFALGLRLFDITSNPKAMYGDELTLVYDAYSILKTGRDQKGEFMPIFFSMGGGRPAGYIYATVPFVALLGPTPLAARLPSVLSGVGIVALMYFIFRYLIPYSPGIGLWAALFSAIVPWELSLSRGAFESHLALFLSLLGFYLFLKGGKNYYLYLASGLSFALSMQTYSTYALTTSLFISLLIVLFRKKFPQLIISILIVILSLAVSISVSVSRGSKDRFTNLLIFNQKDLQAQISAKVTTERLFSSLKPELANRAHNRYLENAGVFIQNYIKNFSIEFLFLTGDKNPRHNPAESGELYYFMLPLLILGSIYLYTQNKKTLVLISGWLLIVPLSSSLVGPPHALRSSFMLPPLIMLLAAGMEGFYAKGFLIKPKILKLGLMAALLIQLPFFINRFYFLSPNLNAYLWSYSAKKASDTALENKHKYDNIILSTSIADMEFAYPVYAKIDPNLVIEQNRNRTYIGEHAFMKFDNVYLGSIPSSRIKGIMHRLKGSVLYLGPIEDRGNLENETITRDKDDSVLFVVSTKAN